MLTVTHAALRLGYAVQSSYKLNLPPHLTVHASNIKMTESIGQGKLKLVIIFFTSLYYIVNELLCCVFRGIWCGLQRTSFGGWRENCYCNCGDKNSKRLTIIMT